MRWLWVASPLVLLHIDAVCCCAHRSLLLLNTRYVNHAYCQPPPEVLGPVAATPGGPRRRVWAQGLVLMPSASLRHLQLWSDYYLRWDRTVERVRWQLSSLSGWAAQASRRDALQDMLDNVETAPAQPSDGISRKKYVLVTSRRCVSGHAFCVGMRGVPSHCAHTYGACWWSSAPACSSGKAGSGSEDVVAACADCDAAFGFFRRRKLCACCGGTFCTSCCSMQRRIAADTGEDAKDSVRAAAKCALASNAELGRLSHGVPCVCVCGRGEAGCCPTAIGSCVSQLRRTHRPVQPGPPVDTVEICDGGCAER